MVDNQSFLWYRGHLHIENICVERLRVFVASDKNGFLEINFRAGNGVSVGYPEAGVIFWYDQEITYNLNRPAVIAALIRYALQNGWRPHDSKSSSNSPLVWENGIELLSLAEAPSDLSKPHPNLGRFWVPRDTKIIVE